MHLLWVGKERKNRMVDIDDQGCQFLDIESTNNCSRKRKVANAMGNAMVTI